MRDSFITAVNSSKGSLGWFDLIAKNLSNVYTPGFKEIRGQFSSFLDGRDLNELNVNQGQGKSIPGVAPENVFLEGKGFFTVRKDDDEILYTKLGDFHFDGNGTYKTKDGYKVQGYILDKTGKIMNSGSGSPNPNNPSKAQGGAANMTTTDITLWVDPANGKYLGKYDEWKIEGNGIIYGSANNGKVKEPLFKMAIVNFNNSEALTQPETTFFSESDGSGKPVPSSAETRSGLLEMSNVDLRTNIHLLQQAKLQLQVTNKLISTNKSLLEEALKLIQ